MSAPKDSPRDAWLAASTLRFAAEATAADWTVVAVPAGERPGDGYALRWRDKIDRETLNRRIPNPLTEDD